MDNQEIAPANQRASFENTSLDEESMISKST